MIASGLLVLGVVVALAYLVGPAALSPARAPITPAGGAAGEAAPAQAAPAAPAPAEAAGSPRHLAEQPAIERYFNVTTPRQSDAGGNVIGIRPELDERRQGYVLYALGGRFRTLSTVAQISETAAPGTRQRMEIWGDGRLLFAEVVSRGADRTITGLDVAGVDRLRFSAVSADEPRVGDPYAAQAAFVDPVVGP